MHYIYLKKQFATLFLEEQKKIQRGVMDFMFFVFKSNFNILLL